MQLGEQVAEDAVLLAPQADDNQWYPESFLAPRQDNQPWLDAALNRVDDTLEKAVDRGFGRRECTLVGFSQGACLAAEYTVLNAARYGGVFCFSGGLIGETVDGSQYTGDIDGTPVFLGCDDNDPYIPVQRVHDTAAVFEALDAAVETYIEPGMGHTVNNHEQNALREHLSK